MKLVSLDNIVRSALTTSGLPIHYYYIFLHNGIRCLRELNLDIMRNIIPVLLPVDNAGQVTLPKDYVDFVRIGYEWGQFVAPMQQEGSINRLPYYNSSGQIVKYPSAMNQSTSTNQQFFTSDVFNIVGYGYYWYYLNNYNNYGEDMDGYYGLRNGFQNNTFKVIPERGIIQLNQATNVTKLYLEYISDGFNTTTCNCGTMVNLYAYDVIEKYIIWKVNQHNMPKTRLGQIDEMKNDYDNAIRILRSRMNPITKIDILSAFRKGYQQTIKTF